MAFAESIDEDVERLWDDAEDRAKDILRKYTRVVYDAPPPTETAVQWAEKHRVLTSSTTSRPGVWKASTVPMAEEPLLAVSEGDVRRMTVIAGTQMFKSELLINIALWASHRKPGPILILQPTSELARDWGRSRLTGAIRASEVMTGLVGDHRGGNIATAQLAETTFSVSFLTGATISLASEQSKTALISRPVRVLLMDEVDEYQRASVIGLAKDRLQTFDDHLMVMAGTVGGSGKTFLAQSILWNQWLMSERREWHVPCAKCGVFQPLEWKQVRWDKDELRLPDPVTAKYICESCGDAWDDEARLSGVRRGKYVVIGQQKTTDGVHLGFRVSGLCNLQTTISSLVEEWREGILAQRGGDEDLVKHFVSSRLTKPYEGSEYNTVFVQKERQINRYSRKNAPEGIDFVTAGVDVQKDRLETEIAGWSLDGQKRWGLKYFVQPGSPTVMSTWNDLDDVLYETIKTADGRELVPTIVVVDCGGFAFEEVIRSTLARGQYGWKRVKGMAGSDRGNLVKKLGNEKTAQGVEYTINGVLAKNYISSQVASRDGENPVWLWPDSEGYGELYWRGIVSERKEKVRDKFGKVKETWKVQDHSVGTEPIDLAMFNLAARTILRGDIDRHALMTLDRSEKQEMSAEDVAVKYYEDQLSYLRSRMLNVKNARNKVSALLRQSGTRW